MEWRKVFGATRFPTPLRSTAPLHNLGDGAKGQPAAAVMLHEQGLLTFVGRLPGTHQSRVGFDESAGPCSRAWNKSGQTSIARFKRIANRVWPHQEPSWGKTTYARLARSCGLTAVPCPQHYFASMEASHAASEPQEEIREAARLIRAARYLTAFTGAGISVESGIPPFRGEGGLWSQYDPRMLELDYFLAHPDESWPILREIFYDNFGKAKPNRAHEVLAAWETRGWPREPGSSERGYLKVLITQNIDSVQ
jgi:hypothetical protein